jgi:hypothetical protein
MDATKTNPQVLLDEGLKRAMERCRREMPTAEEWRAGKAFEDARHLLGRPETMDLWIDWQDRAALLFVELIAVGTYARVLNDEPSIASSELTMYAEWIKKILNSWFHE